jgi:ABC-type arginine transport system ATPase subunit
MLGPDFEPISISDEELSLLRLVDENPDVPLGILSGDQTTASLARGLMSKKLLLLKADVALLGGIT